jgi:hypothetical protein
MAPGSPMKTPDMLHYGSLSPARKRLIDVLHALQFGRIENLSIAAGEPQFDDPPTIVRSIKLPAEAVTAGPCPPDFALKQPMLDLLLYFDSYQTGMVRRLECRFGQPCLVEFVAGDVDAGRIPERATPRRTT